MSLRERIRNVSQPNEMSRCFALFGVLGNPFPAAEQSSGHPRMEGDIDEKFAEHVREFESAGRSSQVVLIEGTQGVGKTNLLNYYEQQFRELYEGDEAYYIIRYYPDPEPSFDSVLRRVFQGLDDKHFEQIGQRLSRLSPSRREDVIEVARNHDVRIMLNSLQRAGAGQESLAERARLALEWLGGLRLLKKHRDVIGVDYRLDTVESRTQALRDIVYVSEKLDILKGIILLLDELEKQDYSLSKTPVLRFLSAIRALIDALPSNLFLVLAMTPQARLRYFSMVPALAGRLQNTLELRPIQEFGEARDLCKFYIDQARANAMRGSLNRQQVPGKEVVFDDQELRGFFDELRARASERGTEGVTSRDYLHRLHKEWAKKIMQVA